VSKPVLCFVDDDVNELERFAEAFGNRFHVITGESAEACFKQLRRERRRCDLWVLDLYFPKAGVENTAEQRQEMNRRFAGVAAAHREFDAFLQTLGQGPAGGLSLMKRIGKRNAKAPVMFLTRKGTLADSVACRDAGAVDVTFKPMPASGEATVKALDRAMSDAAEELGERFLRIIRQSRRLNPTTIGAFVVGLWVGIAACAALIAAAALGAHILN